MIPQGLRRALLCFESFDVGYGWMCQDVHQYMVGQCFDSGQSFAPYSIQVNKAVYQVSISMLRYSDQRCPELLSTVIFTRFFVAALTR